MSARARLIIATIATSLSFVCGGVVLARTASPLLGLAFGGLLVLYLAVQVRNLRRLDKDRT